MLRGKTEKASKFLKEHGNIWEIIYHAKVKDTENSVAMLAEKQYGYKGKRDKWGVFNENEFEIVSKLSLKIMQELRKKMLTDAGFK